MVPIAPRYDACVYELAKALDDPCESMAETCRRVGELVESFGLFRPSYSHLRRFLAEKREEERVAHARTAELPKIAADVYLDTMRGYRVNAYDVIDRVRDAGR